MAIRKEAAQIEECSQCSTKAFSVTIEDDDITLRCLGENCATVVTITPEYTVDGIVQWLTRKGASYLGEEALGLLLKMVLKVRKPDSSEE